VFLRRLFGLMPADPFTEGLQLMQKGELRPALAVFEPLLANPDEATRAMAALYACEALLQLGDQLVDTDPDAALECFESASGLQPTYADIHHRVGRLRHQKGEDEAALMAYGRALAINPRFFSARLEAFEILVRRADPAIEEALAALEAQAPAVLRPDVAALRPLWESGNREALAARVMAVRERSPDPRQSLKLKVVQALQNDDPEGAIQWISSAPDGGRRFPDLLHLLGLAHGRLGQQAHAEAAFREALRIHPGFTKARINLALTLIERQRWQEAGAELEIVLTQDPAHPLALGALEEIRAASRED
jgi:tetratricopeptide (TPR) repeat protein